MDEEVFADGSRVDLSITTDKDALSEAAAALTNEAQASTLQDLTNEFKFEAFLAVAKLARDDLLIGLHLILELERKCLVLAMMLRDRELGTTHHRFGGVYNEVTSQLGSFGPTKTEQLDRLQNARELFSKLAKQIDPQASDDWRPLEEFVKQAKTV